MSKQREGGKQEMRAVRDIARAGGRYQTFRAGCCVLVLTQRWFARDFRIRQGSWAYQSMMIAEHRKCGERGWYLYDSTFRQQITSLETVDFSRVNQSLYLTTFLAYASRGQFCTHCMLSDHLMEESALTLVEKCQWSRFRTRARGGGNG